MSSPVSNELTLYVPGDYSDYTLRELVEKAADHFGMTTEEVLDGVDVSAERIQERGCSCCYDPSDWAMYVVMNRTV